MKNFWDKGIKLVSGCTKVSEGCVNCWAEKKQEGRFHTNPCYEGLTTGGKFNGKVRFNLHLLEKAVCAPEPQIYAIWNDLYHPDITDDQILTAIGLMALVSSARHDTYLIVTKRAERAVKIAEKLASIPNGLIAFPDNIWHIVTCENQARADERIPHLLKIPGKRGIIIEPMLEAIRFYPRGAVPIFFGHVNQVICGPENGPGKRPFDEAWAEDVRKQCEAAGVPYYRKDKDEGVLVWR